MDNHHESILIVDDTPASLRLLAQMLASQGYQVRPAPDGALHELHALRGNAGLLVVFVCNHCPYVIHLAAALADLACEIDAEGVATVAISSTDIERYPADAPEQRAVFAAEQGWNFPYLCDETQEVAKAYGAACTPDFFLFDQELRLYYAGQFDATRPKSGQPATGDDLRAAVKGMLAGEEPHLPYQRPPLSKAWLKGEAGPVRVTSELSGG
jgi:peroxiredoxin